MDSREIIKEEPTFDLDETLEQIRHALEDYSEIIPPEVIHGMPDGKLLKIQINWIQLVVMALCHVREHIEFRGGIVPVEISDFLAYVKSESFRRQARDTGNTDGDVRRANTVLELSKKILSDFK